MNIDLIVNLSDKTKEWAMSFQFKTENEAIEAVKQDGYALQYVKNQSESVCIEAVKRNSEALKYVDFNKDDLSTENEVD